MIGGRKRDKGHRRNEEREAARICNELWLWYRRLYLVYGQRQIPAHIRTGSRTFAESVISFHRERWMASECERAKLPVVLMQADASTSVAAFHRHFMVFLSGKRPRQSSFFSSTASSLILGPWS